MRILVIGGIRYFGKRAVLKFLKAGDEVTLISRGPSPFEFGPHLSKISGDRNDIQFLRQVTKNKTWDVVLDQHCMNAHEAEGAIETLKGKVGHYVLTSSQSVYDVGSQLIEKDFDPSSYEFDSEEVGDYSEGKRQAEAILSQSKSFRLTILRPSIVLGPDDYTKRLEFHIQRAFEGKKIFFPKLDAELSFLNSEDAAQALFKSCRENREIGALNLASSDPIQIREVIEMIESNLKIKVGLSETESTENSSPFGIPSYWSMSVEKALNLGFHFEKVRDWMPSLIAELSMKCANKS